MAARNGLTVVVQELLAKGASVLAVDENGKAKHIFIHSCLVLWPVRLHKEVLNNCSSY